MGNFSLEVSVDGEWSLIDRYYSMSAAFDNAELVSLSWRILNNDGTVLFERKV